MAERIQPFPETRGKGAPEPPGLDLRELRSTLTRAVSKVCPAWLADRREDLVQAAVIRVMEIARKREGNHEFKASYLYKVAHSALVDEIRRVRRRREVPLDPDPDPEGEAPSREVAVTSEDPERRAMDRQIGRGVRACLETLLPERRQAVALHLLGHSVPDAARILGWASKKTENLVYRGLADLRKCLEAKGLTP